MHHSYTHTNCYNNTNQGQHTSPSQTHHHPPTHKQQSTKGQKHCHTSNHINGIRKKIEELKTSYTAPNRTSSQSKNHSDKHNITKAKIHSTCKLLPEHIRHKIEHRNNIRQYMDSPTKKTHNPKTESLSKRKHTPHPHI